jgi:hypothetical protein
MNRREFLTGAAAAAGMGATGFGQAPAQPPAQGREGGRGGRGGGRGRGGPPANATPEKLARIEIMTLNHSNIIKLPWQEATPQRTLNIFDLPQYYVDVYGVRNVQFQSNHVAQDNAYIRELRAKLDAAGAKAHQINIEIGTMAQFNQQTGKAEALSGDARAAWLARAKKWVDFSPTLGVTILMHNQGALTDDSKAGVTALWKDLQDYATPKGVKISGETRGSGAPTPGNRGQRGAPAAPPPAAPTMSEKERIRYVWGILMECTHGSGGYTNLDFGSESRFHDQQELHDAIKVMLPRNSGGMHTRVSPTWDLGLAIKYAESIGYKGRYTIEVNDDSAVRIIYNAILANLA